jgi:putative pyruvate formate lyase activating enzyme
MKKCELCPRKCGIDRMNQTGFCGASDKVKVARAALHYMEEPCISGENGSGTVFFSGCNMKCCFCQNYEVSHNVFGKEITVERLAKIFLELQDKGANNINLVTGVMYVPQIIKALDEVRDELKIPVVYNCGGYESQDTIHMLDGYVDIYLLDIKYYSNELAEKYSKAVDYFKYASLSAKTMIEQVGKPVFYKKFGENNEILKKGVIIRHMVLPGCRKDSMNILRWLAENIDRDSYLISIMSQYIPMGVLAGNPTGNHIGNASDYKEINRRITSFEYNSVVDEALRLGIDIGYMQEKTSATSEYTPDFNLEGV